MKKIIIDFFQNCKRSLFSFKRNLLLLIIILIFPHTSNAKNNIMVQPSIYGGYGYRVDNLDWNIASDLTGTQTPNIISELTWEKLEIFQFKIGAVIPLIKIEIEDEILGQFFLDGHLIQGNIFDGTVQDSDYNGDNRTLEFSRSNNSSDSGTVQDYSLYLGYKFPFIYNSNNYFLVPKIGYSIHEQNLTLTDGYQTIPNTGAFSGLNSTYDTNWKGIFLGLDLIIYLTNKHLFKLSSQFHSIKYYAQADWNLRTDFAHPKSYDHTANGNGSIFSLKYQFQATKNISLNLIMDHKNFTAEDGVIRFFLANGNTGAQKLNEVNWNSTSLMGGLSISF